MPIDIDAELATLYVSGGLTEAQCKYRDCLRELRAANEENAALVKQWNDLDVRTEAKKIICAWGNDGSHLRRSDAVLKMLRDFCPHKLTALKVSKTGQPSHPLYLSYELLPTPFGESK